MSDQDDIQIIANRKITAEQLFAFYQRNNICEAALGQEIIARVLTQSGVIVGAFEEDKLVGIARAMFDGVTASIVEFSLELEYQGDNLKYANGSLIEKDAFGLGSRIGEALMGELQKLGALFIECYIVENCEEAFYRSIGFEHNKGHSVYIVDKRQYTTESTEETV